MDKRQETEWKKIKNIPRKKESLIYEFISLLYFFIFLPIKDILIEILSL